MGVLCCATAQGPRMKKIPPAGSWHHLKHVDGQHSRERENGNSMLRPALAHWLQQTAKGLEKRVFPCIGEEDKVWLWVSTSASRTVMKTRTT